MVAARFSNRGLAVGAPISVALLFAVTLGVDPGYVLNTRSRSPCRWLIVACAAAYLGPLVASDVRHRADSTLDADRAAQPPRARAASPRSPTGRAGRPAGQRRARRHRPLQEVNDGTGTPPATPCCATSPTRCATACARSSCSTGSAARSSCCCSRAPTPSSATGLAEALRLAVADARPGGFDLTCSFGVATAEGAGALEPLLAAADSALYAAKRGGRDQVARAARTRLAV